MTVFLCEDGMDGILSGVFAVYESRLPLEDCCLELKEEYEPRLFCEYKEVPADGRRAQRVAQKIRTAMSEEAYFRLYRVSLHKSPGRANCILQFVILGLKYGKRVWSMLQESAVYEVFQMDRYVGNEAHLLREFARFERLSNGIYFCKLGPENQVLELLAEPFSDRFPDMNWIIYDEIHRGALFHTETGHMVLRRGITEKELQWIRERNTKDGYTDMWNVFFHAIAIEERRNPRCQKNMLPIRYRKYMTEFQEPCVPKEEV